MRKAAAKMGNREIAAALTVIRPGAAWCLTGEDMVRLVWLDPSQTRPTDDEIIAAVAALPEPQVEADRVAAYQVDASRGDLLTRLKSATPAQIDSYVESNVTTLPQARTLFKAILKVIALDLRA